MVEGFSLDSVNWPKELENMSDMDKKHSPRIICPDEVKLGEKFEVKVITGKLLKHPNEPGHFIMWSELYAGDRFLGRMNFAPGITEPEVCFRISLEKNEELIAYSMCNLHGLWKNVVNVKII